MDPNPILDGLRLRDVVFYLGCVAAWSLAVNSSVQAQGHRVAFATSVNGSANLGTWADANGEVGLAAADRICQERALAAGLANPTQFVAWLSDSADDAYCRLHGLGGKKATNCAQPSLPVAAGPWVRSDGERWAGSVQEITSAVQRIYLPVLLDEFGVAHQAADESYFSQTVFSGALRVSGGTCADWQSTTDPASTGVGSALRTASSWSFAGTTDCGVSHTLLCLERQPGPSLPPASETGAVAFITAAGGPSDLSAWPESGGLTGVAAGDAICQSYATLAMLESPDSFKAWLSTAAVDAKDRFVHNGPWRRVDGLRIGEDLADLTDGSLRTSLNVSAVGVYLANFGVWTGTSSDGTAGGFDCDGWTSTSAVHSARLGVANTTTGEWTSSFTAGCDLAVGRLYCLADVATELFTDGFETGDTSAWDQTVP